MEGCDVEIELLRVVLGAGVGGVERLSALRVGLDVARAKAEGADVIGTPLGRALAGRAPDVELVELGATEVGMRLALMLGEAEAGQEDEPPANIVGATMVGARLGLLKIEDAKVGQDDGLREKPDGPVVVGQRLVTNGMLGLAVSKTSTLTVTSREPSALNRF